jgi:hypothetical protein
MHDSPAKQKILCIGGPLDGVWVNDSGLCTLNVLLSEEVPTEGGPQEEASVEYHEGYVYLRGKVSVSGGQMYLWVIEGMSMPEAISRIVKEYKKP